MSVSPSLHLDWAARYDPVAMSQLAGITPDPWQARCIRSQARRMLLNASRQSGKSTITALIAVHEASYHPNALVLLLSPSLRQSSELFRKCASIYQALGRPVPSEAETALRLELKNGSRIVSLPGTENTVRGFSSPQLIICDEAARIPESLFIGVMPMLAVSNGRLILLSTPFGSRGYYYECYRNRVRDGWDYYEVTAQQCPRISPSFLEQQRRMMSAYAYSSEYMCEFLEPAGSIFTREALDRLTSEEVEPWNFSTLSSAQNLPHQATPPIPSPAKLEIRW